jgi:hypothetical protein
MSHKAVLAALALACASPAAAFAAPPPNAAAQAQEPSRAERAAALDALSRRISHYVIRDSQPALVRLIRQRRAAWLAMPTTQAFADAVNEDLFKVARDKHLRLWVHPPDPPPSGANLSPQQIAELERAGWFGITAVRRLSGNVAYLRLQAFNGSPEAAAAVDQAFGLLANGDALIIDLRQNMGGAETTLRRIMSHLFPEPVEMGAIAWRQCAPSPEPDPEVCRQIEPRLARQFTDTLSKPLYPKGPVFVLTSASTFSAAEALAFELQVRGRAVVVGERTGGGGRPSMLMNLTRRFAVLMPIGVGRHPTGRDFEGVGVAPDVPAPAANALIEAYKRALDAASASADPDVAYERADGRKDPAASLKRDIGE